MSCKKMQNKTPFEGGGLNKTSFDGGGLNKTPFDGGGLNKTPFDGGGLNKTPFDGGLNKTQERKLNGFNTCVQGNHLLKCDPLTMCC